jgi:hypothetical protein
VVWPVDETDEKSRERKKVKRSTPAYEKRVGKVCALSADVFLTLIRKKGSRPSKPSDSAFVLPPAAGNFFFFFVIAFFHYQSMSAAPTVQRSSPISHSSIAVYRGLVTDVDRWTHRHYKNL